MSMKVVFLKDTPDHKAGWAGFIPRQLGRRLCHQEIAIPWSIRHYHSGYQDMKKVEREKEEKERAKAEAKAEKERKKELISAKKKPGRKKAVLVDAEKRETAVAE